MSVFHGRIEQGRILLGETSIAVCEGATHDVAEANVYARPHELEIERRVNGSPSIRARVSRINLAGSLTRVSLVDTDGRPVQLPAPVST